MAKYIDAAAFAGGTLTSSENQLRFREMTGQEAYFEFLRMVNDAPAADVAAVRHGRWEVKCESHCCDHTGEYDEDYHLECSVCHQKVWDVSQDALIMGDVEKATRDFPFCHCGARMDLGGAENA